MAEKLRAPDVLPPEFNNSFYNCSHAHESGGYCYRNVQRSAERFLQVGIQQWRSSKKVTRYFLGLNRMITALLSIRRRRVDERGDERKFTSFTANLKSIVRTS